MVYLLNTDTIDTTSQLCAIVTTDRWINEHSGVINCQFYSKLIFRNAKNIIILSTYEIVMYRNTTIVMYFKNLLWQDVEKLLY